MEEEEVRVLQYPDSEQDYIQCETYVSIYPPIFLYIHLSFPSVRCCTISLLYNRVTGNTIQVKVNTKERPILPPNTIITILKNNTVEDSNNNNNNNNNNNSIPILSRIRYDLTWETILKESSNFYLSIGRRRGRPKCRGCQTMLHWKQLRIQTVANYLVENTPLWHGYSFCPKVLTK